MDMCEFLGIKGFERHFQTMISQIHKFIFFGSILGLRILYRFLSPAEFYVASTFLSPPNGPTN